MLTRIAAVLTVLLVRPPFPSLSAYTKLRLAGHIHLP